MMRLEACLPVYLSLSLQAALCEPVNKQHPPPGILALGKRIEENPAMIPEHEKRLVGGLVGFGGTYDPFSEALTFILWGRRPLTISKKWVLS